MQTKNTPSTANETTTKIAVYYACAEKGIDVRERTYIDFKKFRYSRCKKDKENSTYFSNVLRSPSYIVLAASSIFCLQLRYINLMSDENLYKSSHDKFKRCYRPVIRLLA